MRCILGTLLLATFLVSCSDDDSRPPEVYHLTVGDTSITIADSAVRFAEQNFDWSTYMLREHFVASDSLIYHPDSVVFRGSLGYWMSLVWETRRTYLVPPYTHDAKTPDRAQYYYRIGTYLSQFGFGWKDTFDPDSILNNPRFPTWRPADSTLAADVPSTIGFDGVSRFVQQYRGMWIIEF